MILVLVLSFTLSGKIRSNRKGQEIVLFSFFTFTLYLVVGLNVGTKDIQVPFFTASLLPLNNLRYAWKKKKDSEERKFDSFRINLANLKLDMKGMIKTIRGMIRELVIINSWF